MEFVSLPLDCQIHVLSCYPMYRTLCKLYNEHILHIYYEKYAYLPISLKELNKYVDDTNATEYTAICYDSIIKVNINHETKTQSHSVKNIEIFPKHFDYLYTNKIKTSQLSWDMYGKCSKYKYLDDVTTTNILLRRKSCIHPNYFCKFIEKHNYFPQDNDLDTLVSIIRNQMLVGDANVDIKLSFLHKKIMNKHEKEYDYVINILKI